MPVALTIHSGDSSLAQQKVMHIYLIAQQESGSILIPEDLREVVFALCCWHPNTLVAFMSQQHRQPWVSGCLG